MPSVNLDPIPHDEAARLIAGLPAVSREVFTQLVPELRARAFTIQGLIAADALQEARDAIATIPAGADWDEVKADLVRTMAPLADPDDPEGSERRAQAKAEFLIRHHAFLAYSAANYRNLERNQDIFPYRRYVTAQDERVRSSHAALHGIVLPSDSPFWATHTPPWQFGCRCDVVGLTAADVADLAEEEADLPEAGRSLLTQEQRTQLESSGQLLRRRRVRTDQGEEERTERFDVRTDKEAGKGSQFEWRPGDLSLSAKELRSRYDAVTWAKLQNLLDGEDLGGGATAWDWLHGRRIKEGRSMGRTMIKLGKLPEDEFRRQWSKLHREEKMALRKALGAKPRSRLTTVRRLIQDQESNV